MKGIVFSESMVRAWIEGRKSVTRRLINPQPPELGIQACHFSKTGWAYNSDLLPNRCSCQPFPCPYRPGETVYVKETWGGDSDGVIHYKADGVPTNTQGEQTYVLWKSPRFMPEWAARSHTLIVSVKPERVQAIMEEDAIKEGFHNPGDPDFNPLFPFIGIWDSLYPGSWERNDWVWRIELEAV